ncbi:QacE family quaternary ammonium compound efflux SMR transporter [Priestia aryabhattai]|uniref:DMT family transporter n=1 Tax=Bacillaceae TaxID=186817 RepID=UPI000BA11439|nr:MULTISPECIES: multidrug efflux SMR transporter [Bacillaceae]MDT2047889.1 multidrug efflux SMR transporter [Priestia flexa]OZT11802.1 QacE family quaternary ammonium compound efflux SMR transporter [Priestia aryabhattai]TDB52359.1 multidrug efflux SMR transporter [Bacillus sp. CBEL-1]USY56023.1 multidrug efflux SMR transporter [Bacillus sp. 1780r2a1]
MAWIALIGAGICEVGFVIFLKLSDGFKRLLPSIGFSVFSLASFYLLSLALREIPIGTAYSIWTGVGAVGSVLLGMFLFNEKKDWKRLLFISFIVIGVIGLKFTS